MTKVKPQFQMFFPLVLVVDNSVCDNGNEEAYASFKYDENGIRTAEQNTEEGLTWDFATEDGVITGRQSDDGKNDQFLYDASGRPTAMLHNGQLYYYITNQMGDVVGIADENGNLAVENFYDAWGDNYTSAIEKCDFDGKTGWDGAYKLYNSNPMRYRGYYYDVGIGMYYLQSRYFNPTVNRFFNADDPDIAKQSKDVPVGMNLFAYCNNDPVNNTDPTGLCFFNPSKTVWAHDNWEYQAGYIRINNPLKIVGPKKFKNMDIDTDGANAKEIKDPALKSKVNRIINNDRYYQKQTSFKIGGKSINAATINYVVVPVKDKALLGCVATVFDKKKKKRVYAIVADCGPNKYNEVSLKTAWNLGYKNATGNNGPCSDFEVIIWKNSKISWKNSGLQKQINDYGSKYYKCYSRYK